jgi:hypothetical protein
MSPVTSKRHWLAPTPHVILRCGVFGMAILTCPVKNELQREPYGWGPK